MGGTKDMLKITLLCPNPEWKAGSDWHSHEGCIPVQYKKDKVDHHLSGSVITSYDSMS